MNLDQYVPLATRTEARFDTINTEQDTLIIALEAFVASSQLLDFIKKNVIYNKPIDSTKWQQTVFSLRKAASTIFSLPPNKNIHQYTPTKFNDTRLFHGLIGIMTESGELGEALLNTLDNDAKLDTINILEEIGDLNWYQAIVIDTTGGNWSNVLEKNIEKLRVRFPNAYTDEDAIERDLETERAILEQQTIEGCE